MVKDNYLKINMGTKVKVIIDNKILGNGIVTKTRSSDYYKFRVKLDTDKDNNKESWYALNELEILNE